MANTAIPYATKGWGIITGCLPDFPCWKRCWARAMCRRFPRLSDGDFRPRFHVGRVGEPLRWRKPQVVFVAPMGDIGFANMAWGQIWPVIATLRRHQFLLLTKRITMLAEMLDGIRPQDHVWIGVSITNQADADERLPHLAALAVAGWNTWISYEPALGPINVGDAWPEWWESLGVKWLVAGDESGPGARAAAPDWFRSVRDQCAAAGVPFMLKQWRGHEEDRVPALDGRAHQAAPEPIAKITAGQTERSQHD